MNAGFGPAPHAIGARDADAPSPLTIAARKLEGTLRAALSAGQARQVHPRYISALNCDYIADHGARPRVRGADRPHAGRTPRDARTPGAGRCRADTAASRAG
jgi:hypothetical protein